MRISPCLMMLCALCLWASLVRAQSSSKTDGSFSLRLLSWNGELRNLYVDDGGLALPVMANEFLLGSEVRLKQQPKVISFFRNQIDEKGVVNRQTVAEVPVPPGSTAVITVLAPAPEGAKLPYIGRAIDSSPAIFPPETLRVLNLSSKSLALRIGEETLLLDSSGDRLFAYPKNGASTVAVEVAVRSEGGWAMVSRSLRATPAGSRGLCLVRDGRPTLFDPAEPVDAIFLIDLSQK
jgi:hypothetical protein